MALSTRRARTARSRSRTHATARRRKSGGARQRSAAAPRVRGSAHRGKLIVVSAPSGSGKTTIAHEILRRNPSLRFSVSATTRPKREGEVDGRDYYFLTKEEFRRRVRAGEFTEWEEIYGQLYGTLNAEIERTLAAGKSLLLDLDVNGALSIKKHYPEALLIFISPPSVGTLLERLRNRHTEDSETLARRMARVPMEMKKGVKFDARVVNDELGRTVEAVQEIVQQSLQNS